ncbi:MAG: hypothetical protein QOI73_2910 [Solirubrobacteraceae bacterium]|nr:hypothetical protein [Solirubrobacteraceae bacterium]
MTDEQQHASADEAETPDAGGDDEALDVSALMEDGEGGGASEPGDPDAPGVISAEELLEDPGAPETRAPEEIATGEARAQAAAEAGAAAAGGAAPTPQEEAEAEDAADGAAIGEADPGASEPVPEAKSPDAPEQSPDTGAPVQDDAESAAASDAGDQPTDDADTADAPEEPAAEVSDEPAAEPESEAPAEPEAEAPAEPEAEAPADDGGGDDDTPEIDPAVQEYIGQDSTVVHHSSGKDEHGLPTEFRTPPGISGGIDPGTLADRDKKV